MSTSEVLAKVQSGEISVDEAGKLLSRDGNGNRLRCKVSPKGALSVYGLQRMPVILYAQQWERLLNFADEIRRFARDNAGKLATK